MGVPEEQDHANEQPTGNLESNTTKVKANEQPQERFSRLFHRGLARWEQNHKWWATAISLGLFGLFSIPVYDTVSASSPLVLLPYPAVLFAFYLGDLYYSLGYPLELAFQASGWTIIVFVPPTLFHWLWYEGGDFSWTTAATASRATGLMASTHVAKNLWIPVGFLAGAWGVTGGEETVGRGGS